MPLRKWQRHELVGRRTELGVLLRRSRGAAGAREPALVSLLQRPVIVVERRAHTPLLPLRIVLDSDRGTAYFTTRSSGYAEWVHRRACRRGRRSHGARSGAWTYPASGADPG